MITRNQLTELLSHKRKIPLKKSNNCIRHGVSRSLPEEVDNRVFEKIESSINHQYEIFAYCSKNYEDAFHFVIDSWLKSDNVTKVTIYTDWNLKCDKPKVEIIHMFEPSSDWIVGTGRRLDGIKDFSEKNKGQTKNVLFLDIDCYMVHDSNEVFSKDFDIAISRLGTSRKSYTHGTATAGLWFAKLTPGYFEFIDQWFNTADNFKKNNIGLKQHNISYVQYSFTEVANKQTKDFKVYSIDEKVYNSEHSDLNKWYHMIAKHKPKILHFKGRRFRDSDIVKRSLKLSGVNE